MPRPMAGAGRLLEARVAPPFYRGTEVVTPSEATREELLELGFRPGAGDRGRQRRRQHLLLAGRAEAAPRPLVVAAGRMAPVKRFPLLLEAAEQAAGGRARPRAAPRSARVPSARSWRPGSGDHDARGWVHLLGHVDRDDAAGRVPPGLGRGQRLPGRGLGSDPDRGRGLRHAGRGDRHPRPSVLGRGRPTTGVLAAAGAARRRPWPPCCSTPIGAPAGRRGPGPRRRR